MAPINNIPFLNYQLNYLKHFGIQKVILSVGYLHEKIINYYKNSFNGIEIKYSIEDEPMGTGGGIRLAMQHSNDTELLVLNGDSFFDVDIKSFYDFHIQQNAQISLALRNVNNAARYGTITINKQQQIISFKEKSGLAKEGLINGGVYILNKNLFLNNTPSTTNFSIEKDFFETQLQYLTIKGFECNHYFIDIGIPQDYQKAQHDFKDFKYR